MRESLQSALILHHRPYRETSMLLEIFTEAHGRLSLIARGVRKQNSRQKSLLQLFVPLLVSWQGKTELMTMSGVEPHGAPYRLQGECLLSGLYLNELLIRVLPKHDPHPQLYTIYRDTLLELQGQHLQQKVLRLFEKKLLQELGYGLHLDPNTLAADQYYRYHPELGFEPCREAPGALLGKSLMSLALDQLDDEQSLRDAKRLMRTALAPLIGERGLESRKLFLQREESVTHG